MTAYYNEFDPYAAQWLRNLISAGHIAPGEVDERSIVDVRAGELRGFVQCHFFAGIGGWSLAARMAGWDDTRPLWTGSCPCQPFSLAGNQEGQADERHLWPVFFDLIRANRPDVVMGEQVAAAVGKDWLDGVCSDLESIGYACGATVVPACAVDAPHRRDRLWFVADANNALCKTDGISSGIHASNDTTRLSGCHEESLVSNANGGGQQGQGRLVGPGNPTQGADRQEHRAINAGGSYWASSVFEPCADGKARRLKSGIDAVAHGVPARVGKLRAYGNAIVPQVAAQVIGAYMECRP